MADTARYIFRYRHVGKQGIILEQISYMTVLDAHIGAGTGIEQHAVI